MNAKVTAYLAKAEKWREEMKKLRALLLGCGLTEEFKWGKPCYTYQGSNVVLIAGFKDHCVLIMCKGALLDNSSGILIKPGENSQAARQIRFTHLSQIEEQAAIVKSCIQEAMAVEKAGLEVEYRGSAELIYPKELQHKLDKDAIFKAAFNKLTPGRRRAYNIHFSAAAQPRTREARIEKWTPQILGGKGMNDDYARSRKARQA